MTDRSSNLLDNVTPTGELTSAGLPRRTPGAAYADTVIGPRPTPPRQQLTARPLSHDIQAQLDQQLPTAPRVEIYDRARILRELALVDADGWAHYDRDSDEPVIPTISGPHKASTTTGWDWGYGGIAANRAFGEPVIGSAA